MLSAPSQRPLSTRPSTSPPSAGAGSASRTTTARTLPPSPAASPALPPAVHPSAHAAPDRRTDRRLARDRERDDQHARPHGPHPRAPRPQRAEAGPEAGPERNADPHERRPHRRLSLLHDLHRLRTAARSQPDLAEPLEQHHVELGTLLVARERQLCEHLALVRRDVMRRQAVQRVHQHVAPARVAPAEPREPPAQFFVLALHHFECDVPYPTTASSCATGQAVNVEPVVPVSRTRR